jgi:citrate synthase
MIRHLASSGVDPYTALSGAAGALFGEKKSARVVEMIKSITNLNEFLEVIKTGQILEGFASMVDVDPRIGLAKILALEVFDLLGCNGVAKVALDLEKRVLSDEWFISRNFNPTVNQGV